MASSLFLTSQTIQSPELMTWVNYLVGQLPSLTPGKILYRIEGDRGLENFVFHRDPSQTSAPTLDHRLWKDKDGQRLDMKYDGVGYVIADRHNDDNFEPYFILIPLRQASKTELMVWPTKRHQQPQVTMTPALGEIQVLHSHRDHAVLPKKEFLKEYEAIRRANVLLNQMWNQGQPLTQESKDDFTAAWTDQVHTHVHGLADVSRKLLTLIGNSNEADWQTWVAQTKETLCGLVKKDWMSFTLAIEVSKKPTLEQAEAIALRYFKDHLWRHESSLSHPDSVSLHDTRVSRPRP